MRWKYGGYRTLIVYLYIHSIYNMFRTQSTIDVGEGPNYLSNTTEGTKSLLVLDKFKKVDHWALKSPFSWTSSILDICSDCLWTHNRSVRSYPISISMKIRFINCIKKKVNHYLDEKMNKKKKHNRKHTETHRNKQIICIHRTQRK